MNIQIPFDFDRLVQNRIRFIKELIGMDFLAPSDCQTIPSPRLFYPSEAVQHDPPGFCTTRLHPEAFNSDPRHEDCVTVSNATIPVAPQELPWRQGSDLSCSMLNHSLQPIGSNNLPQSPKQNISPRPSDRCCAPSAPSKSPR